MIMTATHKIHWLEEALEEHDEFRKILRDHAQYNHFDTSRHISHSGVDFNTVTQITVKIPVIFECSDRMVLDCRYHYQYWHEGKVKKNQWPIAVQRAGSYDCLFSFEMKIFNSIVFRPESCPMRPYISFGPNTPTTYTEAVKFLSNHAKKHVFLNAKSYFLIKS